MFFIPPPITKKNLPKKDKKKLFQFMPFTNSIVGGIILITKVAIQFSGRAGRKFFVSGKARPGLVGQKFSGLGRTNQHFRDINRTRLLFGNVYASENPDWSGRVYRKYRACQNFFRRGSSRAWGKFSVPEETGGAGLVKIFSGRVRPPNIFWVEPDKSTKEIFWGNESQK